MNCSNCDHTLAKDAKFCSNCGTPVVKSSTITCPNCHTENDPAANFCKNCRYELKSSTKTTSVVENGKWVRLPTEIVRKIAPNEMEKAFSFLSSASKKTIEVPLGSICALVENGSVVDVLPPGRQTTQGWFEELMAQFAKSKSSVDFYFISRQSIGLPLTTTTITGNTEQKSKIIISGDVAHTFTDPARITLFLQQFVGEKTSISLQDVQQQLRPQVDAVVDSAAQTASSKNLHSRIQSGLSAIERATGLKFSVRTTPTKATQTLSFHFGLVDVPSQAQCRNCGAAIQLGSRFCTQCRAPQTIRPSKSSNTESIAMITKDGQHIELDVNVRISGVKPLFSGEFAFGQQVASALADSVRALSLAEISQSNALRALEQTLQSKLGTALTSHNIERCTILDLRSKKEDWLFKTKADMEQVRLELQATKQWLDIGSEELEMEMQVEEFIASRTAAEREQTLIGLAAKLEFDRHRDATKLAHQQQQTEASLSAAEAAFILQQRKDTLAEVQAEHAGQQKLKGSERQYALDQLLAGLNYDAKVATFKRDTAYNRMIQATKIEDLITARSQELDTLAHQHNVSTIKQTQQHAQAKTNQAHNLDIQGTQNDFNNTAVINAAKTQATVDEIRLGTEMSGLKAKDDLAAKQEERRLQQDIQRREQDRLDNAQNIAAAQTMQTSQQDHELAKMESRQRLVKLLEGKSVTEIMSLAAAGDGRSLTDAEAQAIGKIESGEDATRAAQLTEFIEKNGTEKAELLNFFQSIIGNMAHATAHAAAGFPVSNTSPTVQPTEITCGNCGTVNPPDAKFCQGCGQDF